MKSAVAMTKHVNNKAKTRKRTGFLLFSINFAITINPGNNTSTYLGRDEKLPEKVGMINPATR